MGLFSRLVQQLWRIGKRGIGSIPLPNPHRSAAQQSSLFAIARHRLDQHNRISKKIGKSFFTSDLSTNEFLLTREAGCEPIGLVMGTSFYKVGFYGYFRGYRTQTGEVDTLTQAQIAVRELAVSRMQTEAAMLGAQGIIGVRLHQRRKGWGIGMVEFTAIGTAIRVPNRPPTAKPFTSDLSGQEFWQLRQAGYWPKGLVFGACSYYVHSDRQTRTLMNQSLWNRLFGRGRCNQELTQFTQGFQDARELAIMRLSEGIHQLGATGAVGMQIEAREEVIVYQPWTLYSWLSSLFFVGLFVVFFTAILTGNNTAAIIGFSLLFIGTTLLTIIRLFLYNLSYVGTFQDLLMHFVVIGTAIVEDEIPANNPVGKTLIFYPLSSH